MSIYDDLNWHDYFDNDREAGCEVEWECPCGRGDGCDCDGMEQKAEQDLAEAREGLNQ